MMWRGGAAIALATLALGGPLAATPRITALGGPLAAGPRMTALAATADAAAIERPAPPELRAPSPGSRILYQAPPPPARAPGRWLVLGGAGLLIVAFVL